jgi:hypothetical protein
VAGTTGGKAVAPFTFGMTLPADALTKDATEYIGFLVGSSPIATPTRAQAD